MQIAKAQILASRPRWRPHARPRFRQEGVLSCSEHNKLHTVVEVKIHTKQSALNSDGRSVVFAHLLISRMAARMQHVSASTAYCSATAGRGRHQHRRATTAVGASLPSPEWPRVVPVRQQSPPSTSQASTSQAAVPSLQDIVSRGARQAPRRRMWYEEEEEALPFHVRDVATGDELVALLSAASGGDGGGLAQSAACAEGTFDGRAGLVVIEVFSRECRACYSLWPKMRMLLEEVSRETPVTLARVDLNAHPQLARAMGVRMLPWVEFHAGGGAGLSRELCSLRGTRLAFPCSLQPHHLSVLREAAGECAPPRCAWPPAAPSAAAAQLRRRLDDASAKLTAQYKG